ncbi:hypothetical protein BGZ76_004662, partial [Entomortierella beljakovae]
QAEVLSLHVPELKYIRRKDQGTSITQSAFAIVPEEVIDWEDFKDGISQYAQLLPTTRNLNRENFMFRNGMIISGEVSLYGALDHNVYQILNQLGIGRITYNTEGEVIGEPDFLYLHPQHELKMVLEPSLWRVNHV